MQHVLIQPCRSWQCRSSVALVLHIISMLTSQKLRKWETVCTLYGNVALAQGIFSCFVLNQAMTSPFVKFDTSNQCKLQSFPVIQASGTHVFRCLTWHKVPLLWFSGVHMNVTCLRGPADNPCPLAQTRSQLGSRGSHLLLYPCKHSRSFTSCWSHPLNWIVSFD